MTTSPYPVAQKNRGVGWRIISTITDTIRHTTPLLIIPTLLLVIYTIFPFASPYLAEIAALFVVVVVLTGLFLHSLTQDGHARPLGVRLWTLTYVFPFGLGRSIRNTALWWKSHKFLVGTNAVVCSGDGYYLVHHTYPLGKRAEQWGLPGGGVENQESIRNALQRELKQELGIAVTVGKLLAIDASEEPRLDFFFECYLPAGAQLHTSGEVDKAEFFRLDALPAGFYDRHRRVLEAILPRLSSPSHEVIGPVPLFYPDDGLDITPTMSYTVESMTNETTRPPLGIGERQNNSALADFFKAHDVEWSVGPTSRGTPSLEVHLPNSTEPLPEAIECDDETCEGEMLLLDRVRDFPFQPLGVRVRFYNAKYYCCNTCGQEVGISDTKDVQAIVIGNTLDLVPKIFDAVDLSLRPPSLVAVDEALRTVVLPDHSSGNR